MSAVTVPSFARRHSLALSLVSIVSGAAVIIPACGPPEKLVTDTPTELIFTQSPTQVFGGQSVEVKARLVVTGNRNQGANGSVRYYVSPENASSYSINQSSGVLTALTTQTEKERTVTIRVEGIGDIGFQHPDDNSITVVVRSRVTNVQVAPATMGLRVGETAIASALALYASGSPATPAAVVEWSSSNPGIVSVHPSTGLVTAHAPTAGQPVFITAKAEGVTSTSRVEVTVASGPLPTMSVSPSVVQLRLLEAVTVTAQVINPAAGALNVTWVSRNPALVTVASAGPGGGTNTATAIITAVAPTSQPVLVDATYTGGGHTVLSPVAVTVLTPTVTIGARISSLVVGETHNAQVAVANPAFSGGVISWISSDITKATVSQLGLITALAPTVLTQPVTITARYTVGTQTFDDVMPITIAAQVPTSVVVSSGLSGPVHVGSTRAFTASVRDQSQREINGAPVTWSIASSTPPGTASISASGVLSCLAPGTVVVRASSSVSTVFSDVAATCIVPGKAVASIVLDPLDITAPVGHVVPFHARLLDEDGVETTAAPGFRVIYTVATSAIAEMQNGNNAAGQVLTKAAGTTKVFAYYGPDGAAPHFSAEASLHVASAAAGAVNRVRITVNHQLVAIGANPTFSAVALDVNNQPIAGVQFRWHTSPTGALTINPTTGATTTTSTGGALIFASAILPGGADGPTGISAITVGNAGAVLANVFVADGAGTAAAHGATLRAFVAGQVVGSGVVSVAAATAGRAYIPGLITGTYTITLSMPGFATRTFTNVSVTSGLVTSLNGGASIIMVPE